MVQESRNVRPPFLNVSSSFVAGWPISLVSKIGDKRSIVTRILDVVANMLD